MLCQSPPITPKLTCLCLLPRQIKSNIRKKSYFSVIETQAKQRESRRFLTVHPFSRAVNTAPLLQQQGSWLVWGFVVLFFFFKSQIFHAPLHFVTATKEVAVLKLLPFIQLKRCASMALSSFVALCYIAPQFPTGPFAPQQVYLPLDVLLRRLGRTHVPGTELWETSPVPVQKDRLRRLRNETRGKPSSCLRSSLPRAA